MDDRGAFGLRISAPAQLDSLWLTASPESPACTVKLVDALAAPARSPFGEGRDNTGAVAFTLTHGDDGGIVLAGEGLGRLAVAPDGSEVRALPVGRWSTLLTAQALPIAALLAGREIFHASAFTGPDGTVIALVGSSGSGKSTLALHCATKHGGRLLADDVLAVSQEPSGVMAHPGTAGSFAAPADGPPGGDKTRIDAPAASGPGRLSRLILLERTGVPAPPDLLWLPEVDPWTLLGASFNFALQTPERLERQLTAAAEIAATVAVARLRVGPGATPAAAEMLLATFAADQPTGPVRA